MEKHEPVPSGTRTSERAETLRRTLVQKGILPEGVVDAVLSSYERGVGPHHGARVVARAWTDPDFKTRLLEDASEAFAELGYRGMQRVDLGVLENTERVHNVIVCTQCSCFPWLALGLPPTWYKQPAYRAALVRRPRRVLREEFDLDLDSDVDLKVKDVTAERRYFVLPRRPEGTRDMSEEALAELVTLRAMIGVQRPVT